MNQGPNFQLADPLANLNFDIANQGEMNFQVPVENVQPAHFEMANAPAPNPPIAGPPAPNFVNLFQSLTEAVLGLQGTANGITTAATEIDKIKFLAEKIQNFQETVDDLHHRVTNQMNRMYVHPLISPEL